MRTGLVVSVLAVGVVAGACGGAPQQEFTRKDVEAVRQKPEDLAAAFNEQDIPRILNLYADNSVFMPPNRPLIRGRQPLETFYSELMKEGAKGLRLTTDDAGGHGPLAYVYGSYELIYQNGGDAGRRDRGKYLFLLRLGMGQNWRIEKSIWNSDLPPPGR
jgi:ketosteroid isomerase-like protein